MTTRIRPQGFTLIEALVVVAMIAVIVVLLLPALTGSPRSINIRCINNLKSSGMACMMYAEDSHNKLPNLDQKTGNDGPATLILLTNYLKQTNVFICPYVARQREKDRSWYKQKFIPELNRAFFQSNGNDYAYYDGLLRSTNLNALLADRFAWTNRSAVDKKLLNHSSDRINVAFADGHVQWMTTNAIFGTNMIPPWSAFQDPLRRP